MKELKEKLFDIDSKYRSERLSSQRQRQRLRVFYGWAKLGKVRKKEAISVIFENEAQREEKVERSVSRYQTTCFVREQTPDEKKDAEYSNRVFTEYSIFLDDKRVKGSLDAALRSNNMADRNNVSATIRKKIEDALRKAFKAEHPHYKEPQYQQLEFNFEQE